MSGAQVGRRLLDQVGLGEVPIERIPGELTDHYDPKTKVLRLSDGVFNNSSIAALGIVAHECGHAVQDQVRYAPLRWRSGLVPAANIGSNVGYWVFLGGLLLSVPTVSWLGVALFSLATLFALVTLPVELNASDRALGLLEQNSILTAQELGGAKKVLTAAALTYVAALAQSLATLAYFIVRLGGMSSNNRRE
jgi:hypothetical protein